MQTILNKINRRLKSMYLNSLGRVVRNYVTPKFPKNIQEKVCVHIGCGELDDKRFINIDARNFPHVHYVTEDITLSQFADSSIDLIYACHILEHISHRKLESIIAAWKTKLKTGGKVRISVPDFDKIVEIYNDNSKNINAVQNALMGGQEYPTNYHMTAMTHGFMSAIFERLEFKKTYTWDPKETLADHNFDDWAGRNLVYNGKSYPISLNLESQK